MLTKRQRHNRRIKRLAKILNEIKKRWVLSTVIAALLIVILADIFSPFGGQIRYYAKWYECGSRPLYAKYNVSHFLHYYEEAPSVNMFRGNIEYFCTPKEAELAGVSASPDKYYFPHLTEEEIQKQFNY